MVSGLIQRSPHLAGVVRRTDPEALDFLDEVLAFVLESGGESEVGFERAHGVSFNPRPARLALILLQAGVRDRFVLGGAMLSCSATPEGYAGSGASELLALANNSTELAQGLRAQLPGSRRESQIACAAALDLFRHLHQARDGAQS